MSNEFLYRYNSYKTNSKMMISLERFKILKRTPKGIWIDYYGNKSCKKFILLSATKKFACETPELALESFRRRKMRQLVILKAITENAVIALYNAENNINVDNIAKFVYVDSVWK